MMKEPSELAYFDARDFRVGKIFEGVVPMKYAQMIGLKKEPSAGVRFTIAGCHRKPAVREDGPKGARCFGISA